MRSDVFIPNGDDRTETAVLLVGTAGEYGIPQKSIKTVRGGFMVPDALADLLYEEPAKPTKKTSGNRAAKKNSTKEE